MISTAAGHVLQRARKHPTSTRTSLLSYCAKYTFPVDWVKRMTGLTFALFCILLVAAVGQFCLEIDVEWYHSLVKPPFLLSPFGFTVVVSLVYVCMCAVITRLVVGKHFFPSMIFLSLTGVLAVVYIFVMFRVKSVYGASVAMCAVFAVSFIQQVRFFLKDRVLALVYLPVFAFNAYCAVVAFSLAAAN